MSKGEILRRTDLLCSALPKNRDMKLAPIYKVWDLVLPASRKAVQAIIDLMDFNLSMAKIWTWNSFLLWVRTLFNMNNIQLKKELSVVKMSKVESLKSQDQLVRS